ncbi:MAG: hypothetical protein ABSH28_21775, partial [Acidobacteriota bacterium]
MPGVNPPAGIGPEEITRPTEEEIIGAPASAAGAAGESAVPVGICEGTLRGAPQDGQNRWDGANSPPQDGHLIKVLRSRSMLMG